MGKIISGYLVVLLLIITEGVTVHNLLIEDSGILVVASIGKILLAPQPVSTGKVNCTLGLLNIWILLVIESSQLSTLTNFNFTK